MIDTSGFRFPKPGQAEGRLVLKGKKYTEWKRRRWIRQNGLCARRPHAIADPREAAFHHPHGRGMGGGKRDDREGVVVCGDCHSEARIQRRASWVPVPEQSCPAGEAPGVPAGEAGLSDTGLVTSSAQLVFPALLEGGAR